jgi:hypothetical protein
MQKRLVQKGGIAPECSIGNNSSRQLSVNTLFIDLLYHLFQELIGKIKAAQMSAM